MITYFLRSCIMLLSLVAFSLGSSSAKDIPRVYTLDDLEGSIELKDNWDFYWNTTVEGLPLSGAKAYKTSIPSQWNDLGLPRMGYGVYRSLFVVKEAQGKRFGIYVPCVSNNYNFYVNGKLLDGVGHFSTQPAEAIPDYKPRLIEFIPESDTILLDFEVSNFFYREGGINYNLIFGEEEVMEQIYMESLIGQAFSAGALFIMAVYFFFIFFIRKREYISLYFCLLCLFSCLRMCSTKSILIRQFDFSIPWEYLVKIEITSIMLIPACGGLYLIALVEERKYRWVVYMLNAISIAAAIYAFSTTTYNLSFLVPPFRYYATLELFVFLFIMYRAVFVTRHELGRLAAIGYLVIFLFGLNDILYSANIISSSYALPVGIFIYVIIQAIVLAKKSAIAFVEVENLTTQLSEANKNQEMIIEQRTGELNIKRKELEQYNSIKDKIFAIIGHDLRAPIATLSSVLTLAEQADDKTIVELKSYFKGIKRNVDNLNLTIENLLVWAQSQINGVTLKRQAIRLNEEIDNIMALYSLVALQKEIVLMHNLDQEYTVYADPAHINLIFRNVISNSLKFTNMGGSIIITASRPTPSSVQICITDNGIGIQSEKIAQLLNPAAHFTTYGTLNEKGTGLGLMLCKEYIEANNGSITMESAPGMGTKVCITLPAGPAV